MIRNSIVSSLDLELGKDGPGFLDGFVTFLINIMLIMTTRFGCAKLRVYSQAVQRRDSAVHLFMLWTPRVPRENLQPCDAVAF
jgi:hypothetical protein